MFYLCLTFLGMHVWLPECTNWFKMAQHLKPLLIHKNCSFVMLHLSKSCSYINSLWIYFSTINVESLILILIEVKWKVNGVQTANRIRYHNTRKGWGEGIKYVGWWRQIYIILLYYYNNKLPGLWHLWSAEIQSRHLGISLRPGPYCNDTEKSSSSSAWWQPHQRNASWRTWLPCIALRSESSQD